jgi:hypothetical protein
MLMDILCSKILEFQTTISVLMLLLACTAAACAQTGSDQSSLPTDNQQPGTNPPLSLTFQDALARAKKNNPEYRAALTEVGLAREDRVQGRAALLPASTMQVPLFTPRATARSPLASSLITGFMNTSAKGGLMRTFPSQPSPITGALAHSKRWPTRGPRSRHVASC